MRDEWPEWEDFEPEDLEEFSQPTSEARESLLRIFDDPDVWEEWYNRVKEDFRWQ